MNWSIDINKVGNGYICEWWEDNVKKQWVIEEHDTVYGELDAMVCLLNMVKEHFDVHYSKHNKKNIIIKIEGQEDE